jgi:hypothetical protein
VILDCRLQYSSDVTPCYLVDTNVWKEPTASMHRMEKSLERRDEGDIM